ncbi:hypothetical protein PAXRUDRAFT_165771 [Paxillus rubicundulus Ve08.2h10]|uniref:Uncharacterized protein n=1 Tax=Paxillus rubicundulus Ve08.2h10 TaxID=930991 RepID=A0A0D0DI57_9AGAM|nr:hypothetical protein PAXRUDRAFT_165771 [Paxillus rubicundulus Ve08.2h10]
MSIIELLNPTTEAHNIFNAMDVDIYQAVVDAKKAQEGLAVLGASNNDTPVEPVPTHNEALQAALLLQKYTKDLNDPFACKLEMMLGLFGQRVHTKEMQGMKDSKLTLYILPS